MGFNTLMSLSCQMSKFKKEKKKKKILAFSTLQFQAEEKQSCLILGKELMECG